MHLFKNPILRFGIFLLLIVAFGWFTLDDSFTDGMITESIPEQAGEFSVHFCQVADCEQVLLSAIEQASEVKCAFYDLDYDPLEQLLAEKNAELLVFEDNYEGFGKKIPARHGGLMHNKFCILDERIVITGSTNPTENGIVKNDNHIILIEGDYTAQNYLDEFEELKGKKEKKVTHNTIEHQENNKTIIIENYFCPEDNCEDQVLEELEKTQESIHFMTFSFTSDPIGELLIQKTEEGVRVQGVFEKRQQNKYSEYQKLNAAGLDVKFDANPQTMHHKVFIIDNSTVILGSYNPSKNGNERNDENMLIVHDETNANYFSTEFKRIWDKEQSS